MKRWIFDQSREHIINCIVDDTNFIQSHFLNLKIKPINEPTNELIKNAIDKPKNTPNFLLKIENKRYIKR